MFDFDLAPNLEPVGVLEIQENQNWQSV